MSTATASIVEPPFPSRIVSPASRRAVVAPFPTLCSTCALRSTCLPCGMPLADVGDVDEVIYSRRRIRRGEHLYRAGETFTALYGFRSGFFKSYVDTPDGSVQVTGFPMAGEVVGLDGIGTAVHTGNVVALDDGEVCVIPYAQLQQVTARSPALAHQVHRMMSREIVREQGQVALLGNMRADARLAAFLLELSEKFAARGYSPTEFHLRMTRDDIGSYLGVTLETISRALSRLQDQGLVKAKLRTITIVDVQRLRRLVPEF
jgi:CRP/FNR family transcriptional regulator